MDRALEKLDTTNGEFYLSQLEALRAEIEIAVAAISGDDVGGLEESVARQEFLASSLTALLRQMHRDEGMTPLPAWVRSRILSGMHGLQTSVRVYSALLQHSGASIAILASLCRSHTLPCAEVRGARPARQTWSCEV